MERLVVHTEIEIPVVDIPRIGKVHGPMDFLTSPAAGGLSMGSSSNERELIVIRYSHVAIRWVGRQSHRPILYLRRRKKTTSCRRTKQ